jgi:formate--tetrahydrofolate ligase
VATKIYRAGSVAIEPAARKKLAEFEALGYGELPVCMAKTQYSFTADPTQRGAPEGFVLPVREVRLSAGAGFVVVLCGEVMTMPGLPSHPAAENIFVDESGFIGGVF